MLKRANFNHFSNYILANIMDLGCVPIKYFFATGSKSSAFPSKILILRTDGIGDVLVTIPLISSIKEAYPETRIDILIRPKSHEVAKRINAVSEVIVSDTKKSDVMHMLRCRKKGYDLVISPRPDRYIFNHVL